MRYQDPIYGPAEINEPVLLDLLETQAVQRLQGILQHGISGLVGVTIPTTRLEHSIGAMLLVRRLEGTLREQIAALVHDASHTAFSHVIDYVYGEQDIWATDAELWAKLAQSGDGEVQRWLPLVSANTQFVWDEANPHWWISTKIRTLDPDVALDGTVRSLSALDAKFAAHRRAYLQRKTGRWPIRVLGAPGIETP